MSGASSSFIHRVQDGSVAVAGGIGGAAFSEVAMAKLAPFVKVLTNNGVLAALRLGSLITCGIAGSTLAGLVLPTHASADDGAGAIADYYARRLGQGKPILAAWNDNGWETTIAAPSL